MNTMMTPCMTSSGAAVRSRASHGHGVLTALSGEDRSRTRRTGAPSPHMHVQQDENNRAGRGNMFRYSHTRILAVAVTLQACATATEDHILTYDEFKAQAFHGPAPDEYVINGDEPIIGETQLQAAYEDFLRSVADAAHPGESTTQQGLIVNQVNGRDTLWDPDLALSLTYCVSASGFGSQYNTVVSAIEAAGRNWGGVARVHFQHHTAMDSDCTENNDNVVFNVSPSNNLGTLAARAFTPTAARANRQLLIAPIAFNDLPSLPFLLRHELGHVLGFRHENTRPEAGMCFEDNDWRALTAYDPQSVMNSTCVFTDNGMILTQLDITGARKAYPLVSGDDILWENQDSTIETWDMLGPLAVSIESFSMIPLPGSTLQATGDFNGDGHTDLLRRAQNNTDWVVVLAANINPYIALRPDTSDSFAGIGDFDGDGKSDILWRVPDGTVKIWFMNGRFIARQASSTSIAGPEWSLQGVADFDGNGRSDLLWRNQDGTLRLWVMSGASVLRDTPISPAVPSPGAIIQGLADFNGDGRADILWRNQDGTVTLWFMNRERVVTTTTIFTPNMGSQFAIERTGDFNNDRKADIVWRNIFGGTVMWLMDGATITTNKLLSDQRFDGWFIRGVGKFDFGDGTSSEND